MVKAGNCVRKFRSFVQVHESDTLKHVRTHMHTTMFLVGISPLSFLQCFDTIGRVWWLSCGYMSHSTQKPIFGLVWKNKTQQNKSTHSPTKKQHKKTKARFSRLLRDPAWKWRGPILVSMPHKFVMMVMDVYTIYTKISCWLSCHVQLLHCRQISSYILTNNCTDDK